MDVRMAVGYTHAELAILPGTFVANLVGNFIRDRLTEYQVMFNKKTFHNEYTVTGKYASWNPANGMLSIPVGFVPEVRKILQNTGVNVIENRLNDYPLRSIQMSVLPEFQDQPHQVELIKKCSDPNLLGIKGLAMQTGKGKTYSAIKTICNLGYAAVVIAPGLADQWIASFEKFCGERDEIYKIQEFKSLDMLMRSDWKPKVFVCSIQTMQIFSKGKDNYKELPYDYKGFFEHYGIGVKVVDECHLNFHATVRMDLKTNVPHNLYCSATFGQTNKYARRIFDVVYPPSIRFGADKYDKYVTVHFYNYSGFVLEKRCVRMRGYSHMRYEADLVSHRTKFDQHFDTLMKPIIQMHYVNEIKNPGEKLLILASTIGFIDAVADKIHSVWPNFKIVKYVGDAQRNVLDDADVIVATIGKAGTGLDVKNLITVYNTISMRTSILTQQSIGRLRKIKDRTLIYVDSCDVNLDAHNRHAQERKPLLRSMAEKFYEYNGFTDNHQQDGDPNKAWPYNL